MYSLHIFKSAGIVIILLTSLTAGFNFQNRDQHGPNPEPEDEAGAASPATTEETREVEGVTGADAKLPFCDEIEAAQATTAAGTPGADATTAPGTTGADANTAAATTGVQATTAATVGAEGDKKDGAEPDRKEDGKDGDTDAKGGKGKHGKWKKGQGEGKEHKGGWSVFKDIIKSGFNFLKGLFGKGGKGKGKQGRGMSGPDTSPAPCLRRTPA